MENGAQAGAVRTPAVATDGIDWHVEQRGTGPDIVLIPSGEGDCGSYEAVATELAKDFRVTTFDTPGFSRTKVADSGAISVNALAGQIAALMGSLGIEHAVFYGCSSGGLAALDIAIGYPHLVRRLIIHEVALPDPSGRDAPMQRMMMLDDAGIVRACEGLFLDFFNEDGDAWNALGEDFHRRLAANYPTWIRRYVAKIAEHPPIDPAALLGKPISWTIGGLFEVRLFFSNVQLAHRVGIEIATLPSKHFPQVSIPAALAAHIRNAATA